MKEISGARSPVGTNYNNFVLEGRTFYLLYVIKVKLLNYSEILKCTKCAFAYCYEFVFDYIYYIYWSARLLSSLTLLFYRRRVIQCALPRCPGGGVNFGIIFVLLVLGVVEADDVEHGRGAGEGDALLVAGGGQHAARGGVRAADVPVVQIDHFQTARPTTAY